MAGLPKVSALKMSERQYSLLKKESQKYTTKNQEVKRIKILLKGSKGQSNYSISKEVGVTVKTVETWRKRWDKDYDKLLIYEQGKTKEGVTDGELLKEMKRRVMDRPRPGKPSEITLSQKEQIVAIACQKPAEYNKPVVRWTSVLLAEVAIAEKIVDSISPRYVSIILKKKKLDLISLVIGYIQRLRTGKPL